MKHRQRFARFAPRALALAAGLGALLPSARVLADEEGKAGRVIRLTINTQGSDKYASFHGSLAVKRPGSSSIDLYFWGGSTCPAQRLDDSEVAMLASALHNRSRSLVAPRFRTGEGARNTRCLVAFELVANGG